MRFINLGSRKEIEEAKVTKSIRKIHPIGGFGETGSSFDQELQDDYPQERNDNYNMHAPEYSIKGIRHKTKVKNATNRSYAFEDSKLKLNIASIKKLNEPVDVIERYDVKTQIGKTQNKDKKVNQDSYICQKINDYWLFGVLDGHGLYGHNASVYVKRLLPKIIFSNKAKLNKFAAETSVETSPPLFNKKSKISLTSASIGSQQELEMRKGLHNSDIITGFKKVHKNCEEMKPTFDPSFSGTTVNIVFINSEEKKLI